MVNGLSSSPVKVVIAGTRLDVELVEEALLYKKTPDNSLQCYHMVCLLFISSDFLCQCLRSSILQENKSKIQKILTPNESSIF